MLHGVTSNACVPARCRAQAAAEKAGSGADVSSAAAGTLVCVHVAAVPQDAAERLVQRVAAFQVMDPFAGLIRTAPASSVARQAAWRSGCACDIECSRQTTQHSSGM